MLRLLLRRALLRVPRAVRPETHQLARRLPPAADAAPHRHDRRTASWRFGLHVHGMKQTRDPLHAGHHLRARSRTRRSIITLPRQGRRPTSSGASSRWSGGSSPPPMPGERFFIFGADRLGRDMLSRIIYGTRVSMSIGLVGVGAVSLILGLMLGGISGYFGGFVDIDHPARRRADPVAADDPDLAGPQRRAAAGLVAAHPLLRHHADPVAGRLDRARPRRARPLPRAAHRGFRHRRAPRRRQPQRA